MGCSSQLPLNISDKPHSRAIFPTKFCECFISLVENIATINRKVASHFIARNYLFFNRRIRRKLNTSADEVCVPLAGKRRSAAEGPKSTFRHLDADIEGEVSADVEFICSAKVRVGQWKCNYRHTLSMLETISASPDHLTYMLSPQDD